MAGVTESCVVTGKLGMSHAGEHGAHQRWGKSSCSVQLGSSGFVPRIRDLDFFSLA